MRPSTLRSLAALCLCGLAIAVASSVPACSDEGEGQPCSVLGVNNGNDECQNGYTCTRHEDLNPPDYAKDVCCPGDRHLAVTQICSLNSNPIAADAAPPPEAEAGPPVNADAPDGPPEEAAPGDALPEATGDASSEAAADAPADGG